MARSGCRATRPLGSARSGRNCKTTGELPVAQASPFLENFLIDARECWQTDSELRVQSGPWIETAPDGREVTLEASALRVGGAAVLLLERQGEAFETKRQMLQTARETVIALQRLNSETRKKEVLLSWIAEQMTAALGNLITSLRLLELENNHPPRTRQLLSLAARAAADQQALIHRILTVFRSELETLYGQSADSPPACGLAEIVRAASATAAAWEKPARLAVSDQTPPDTRVAMSGDHLRRAVCSVLEICLTNTKAGGVVSFELRAEEQSVALKLCDDGPPLPPDLCDGLLSKASSEGSDASLLRLQFCRAAVERAGGEILYEAREPVGNCFTLRIPQAEKVSANL